MGVLVREDKEVFARFNGAMSRPEIPGKIAADNVNYMDTSFQLAYAFEEVAVTRRDELMGV